MDLCELRKAFEAGTLGKYQFAQQAFLLHRRLFEYPSFLEGTNIHRIEIVEAGVILELKSPPIRLFAPPEDEHHTAVASLNFRAVEGPEFAMACKLFPATGTFFDVGANAGFYGLGIATCFPKARVVAAEAIPQTFENLRRNIALNSLTNIIAHNVGISDRCGEAMFYFNPTISGAASACATADPEAQPIRCPVQTLDALVETSQAGLDFLKCDVEGAELMVLRGGERSLRRHKPIVFCEMLRKWSARFNYHPNDIIHFLSELGYTCHTLADSESTLIPFARMTDSTVETNFFFLHREKHQDLSAQQA
jgi:FkbM family methyltransferase